MTTEKERLESMAGGKRTYEPLKDVKSLRKVYTRCGREQSGFGDKTSVMLQRKSYLEHWFSLREELSL